MANDMLLCHNTKPVTNDKFECVCFHTVLKVSMKWYCDFVGFCFPNFIEKNEIFCFPYFIGKKKRNSILIVWGLWEQHSVCWRLNIKSVEIVKEVSATPIWNSLTPFIAQTLNSCVFICILLTILRVLCFNMGHG